MLERRRILGGTIRYIGIRLGFILEILKYGIHFTFGAGKNHFVVCIDAFHAQRADDFIAAFHFFDRPAQHLRCFFRVHHHRVHQMRNTFIGRQLQTFGIDHQKLDVVGLRFKKDAANHGVERDALAGTGGPGDEQMRHFSQIGNDRRADKIDTQRDGQAQGRCGKRVVVQDILQKNRFSFEVGDFNADDGFAGNRRQNADAGRHQRQGQVV